MNVRTARLIGLILGPSILILSDIVFSKSIEPTGFIFNIQKALRFCTFFSFPAGVLMGHWYHPVDHLRPIIRTPWNYITLGIIALIIFVLGAVFLYALKIYTPQWFTVLFGLVIGSLLWPVQVND